MLFHLPLIFSPVPGSSRFKNRNYYILYCIIISANIHVDINSTCFRIEVNFDIEQLEVEQLAVFQHVIATLKEIQNSHFTKFQLTENSERGGCIGSDELILHQTTITEFVQSILWVARRHVFTMFQL
jgi:hypothetical protein